MSDTLKAVASKTCCGGWPHPCWRVRCSDCGEWVTKHDFTKDEALAIAADHDCPRRAR